MLMRLADLFFLARPTLFFVNWIVLILGFTCPGNRPEHSSPLWLLMVQYACISGAAVIVNQLQDRQSDRANGKLLILEKGLVGPGMAVAAAGVMLLSGVGLALYLGRLNVQLTAVFFVLAGLVYNLPPLATKNRPWAGMATLAPATMVLYLQAALQGGSPGVAWALLHSVPIVAACLGVGVLTTLPDREGDGASGKRTFPVCYGIRRTWQLAGGFMALSLGSALALAQPQVALPALGALALIVWGARRAGEVSGPVARWSILAQALALVPGLPGFGVLMLVFFGLARVYYKHRFGLVYPRLGWDN